MKLLLTILLALIAGLFTLPAQAQFAFGGGGGGMMGRGAIPGVPTMGLGTVGQVIVLDALLSEEGSAAPATNLTDDKLPIADSIPEPIPTKSMDAIDRYYHFCDVHSHTQVSFILDVHNNGFTEDEAKLFMSYRYEGEHDRHVMDLTVELIYFDGKQVAPEIVAQVCRNYFSRVLLESRKEQKEEERMQAIFKENASLPEKPKHIYPLPCYWDCEKYDTPAYNFSKGLSTENRHFGINNGEAE